MSYVPGDIYYKQFITTNISGVSQNADALPWGTLNKNGADDFSAAAKVFVSNIDIGRYNISGVIPVTYTTGNSVNLTASGIVNGVLVKAVFDLGVLDTYRLSNYVVQSIAPGVTVSVTGNVPTVGTVLNAITLPATAPNNFIAPASVQPGVTVSVTGSIPASISGPVSVSGGTINHVIDAVTVGFINPGLTVSVTGNIPTSVTGPVSVSGGTINHIIDPVTVGGTAPANFLGIGSIAPGVTVSVTGSIPASISGPVSVSGGTINHLIDAVTLPTLPNVTVGSILPGLTVSVTGSAPKNFIGLGSIFPGVTVSVTGNVPTVGSVTSAITLPSQAPNNFIVPASVAPGVTVSVTGSIPFTVSAPVSVTGLNTFTATDITQIRYKLGIDGSTSVPVNTYGGQLELSQSGLSNIMVENNINLNQMLSMVGAVLCGSSTVTNNNITYYAINNNGTARLTSTAISGARNTIVLFLP